MYFPLRRYVWVVDLIGILVAAGLAGHAVATRIADAMPVDVSPPRRAYAAVGPPLPASPWEGRAEPTTRADVLERIRKIGSDLYEVPRGILDHWAGLSPPGPLLVLERRAGKPVGFRIFGVNQDGLPAAIGLASGDVLLELNGVPLADPDSNLIAYTGLRTRTHAWLLIERAGRRIRLDYVIR